MGIVLLAIPGPCAAAKSPLNQNTASREWVDPIVLQLHAAAQSAAEAGTTDDMGDEDEVFVPPTEKELMAE